MINFARLNTFHIKAVIITGHVERSAFTQALVYVALDEQGVLQGLEGAAQLKHTTFFSCLEPLKPTIALYSSLNLVYTFASILWFVLSFRYTFQYLQFTLLALPYLKFY